MKKIFVSKANISQKRLLLRTQIYLISVLPQRWQNIFADKNQWGKPDAIREVFKELHDEKDSCYEDDSKNEEFIEIQNHKFTD